MKQYYTERQTGETKRCSIWLTLICIVNVLNSFCVTVASVFQPSYTMPIYI